MKRYRVDREYWSKFSFPEQMGNVGSEVGRAIRAHASGNAKRERSAFDRALDLLDATAECLGEEDVAKRLEVKSARDRFLRLFEESDSEEELQSLEGYFMKYALAARQVDDGHASNWPRDANEVE